MAICLVKQLLAAVEFEWKRVRGAILLTLLEHSISFAARLRLSEHFFKYRPGGHCTAPAAGQCSFHFIYSTKGKRRKRRRRKQQHKANTVDSV